MTPQAIKAALVDRSVLALTAWAEARGDWRQGNSSVEERIAVLCVIRNRVRAYKSFGATEPTYRAICLAPRQFSCWSGLGGSANFAALLAIAETVVRGDPISDPLLLETFYLADGVIAGVLLDRTNGATGYFAPKAMKPLGLVPSWAAGQPTLAIGEQLFLKA